MAHLLDMTNGRASMAFVGELPWHGLGQKLSDGASIDQWRVEAGLDWSAKRQTILFTEDNVEEIANPLLYKGESDILYRSDNFQQLGIVSPSYKIVQPGEVLEFFRDIVAQGDMKLETAGSLDNGRKVWALAKTGQSFRIKGQDEVGGYLLLATSFDGTLATRAQFTSVRVVCNNTLQISLKGDKAGAVSIPHSSTFDARGVKIDLGILGNAMGEFEEAANVLAGRRVSQAEAVKFLIKILAEDKPAEELSTRSANIVNNVLSLFNGKAYGSQFASADQTAWGLVNAVTQYVDHEQGRSVNNRFRSAQFGKGATVKNDAFAQALKLVA